MQRLSVNVFPAGFNWPLWIGQEKGFFARHGIEVQLLPTANSIAQLTGLIEGRFDIAMTAIDNVIAYREGQGEAPVDAAPDIFGFMGSSTGALSLMTVPEVKRFDDLRGGVLAVDAMTTGYSFVMMKMLENAGLSERDYTLISIGGMVERYAALMGRKQLGTLLVPPYSIAARDKGFTELACPLEAFGHFQAGVGAARRAWATDHRDALVGFIRGNIAAVDWLYDPQHREEALAIFRRNLPKMAPDLAARSYDVLLGAGTGFQKKCRIDVEGIRTVMALRSQYGVPRKSLVDPAPYYDLSCYDAAMAE